MGVGGERKTFPGSPPLSFLPRERPALSLGACCPPCLRGCSCASTPGLPATPSTSTTPLCTLPRCIDGARVQSRQTTGEGPDNVTTLATSLQCIRQPERVHSCQILKRRKGGGGRTQEPLHPSLNKPVHPAPQSCSPRAAAALSCGRPTTTTSRVTSTCPGLAPLGLRMSAGLAVVTSALPSPRALENQTARSAA